MRLTTEQKDVVKKIYSSVKKQDAEFVSMGGFAGTGKTTVVKTLSTVLPNFTVCAYTGKATNVLRKKGIHNVSTIHSLIYRAYKDLNNNTVWTLASKYDIPHIDGFIVDEASMVSEEIHRDLLSFGKPIVYVGDHGQLEPIGGTKFNLMTNPTFKLEEIHRNAGEIAHFAAHLRQGLTPRMFNATNKVQIVDNSVVTPRHMAKTDQVLCAFNKTRVMLNQQIRKEKKIELAYICIGEKIMCLKNNRKLGLFNGMQGIVKKIKEGDKFDFVSDGYYYEDIQYDPDQFGKETNEFSFSAMSNPFDYGYAISVHKSQGDQWNNVMVYEQQCDKWDHNKWAYTAASRAVNGLVWIEARNYLPSYLK